MMKWIAPDQIFDGRRILKGKALGITDGYVSEIADTPKDAVVVKGMISPGFVDLQVNGGGGVLLNASPTVEGMAAIATAHRRFGTVAVLPTLITDRPEVLDRASNAALAARDQNGLIGLHIEGPHIAPTRRGTHAANLIRPMDGRTLDVVARLRKAQVPTMITVAPEATTPEQIRQLTAMGAVVSLGHTDASSEQMEAAFAAGANCATHLYNAMSPMTSRAPGAVGAVINSDCFSGVICDGHHVDDRMVALAIRARPVEGRMFLVSDAMPTVGGSDQFELYGQKITVKDGRLINADGNLAGAHLTMAQALQRLVEQVGVSLEQALRMAISVPATCIKAPELGELLGRAVQDVILLDARLNVQGDLARLLPLPNPPNQKV